MLRAEREPKRKDGKIKHYICCGGPHPNGVKETVKRSGVVDCYKKQRVSLFPRARACCRQGSYSQLPRTTEQPDSGHYPY